jgi:WD40 repeat protein
MVKREPGPRVREANDLGRATATPSATGVGASAAELPGIDVPDHTLVRRIGKGSYGEVWLGRNALGTWRAVKIVRRSAFDADRPYEREFAGIQRFEPISRSHESQLNILQVGRVEDGFYYVMELADDMGHGRHIDADTYTPHDLRSEIHLHGRLPVARCLRLGLALTTALEHLHRNGLVHRDIKPSNIVFVNGIPKLADIGLVAQAEATLSFVGTEGFVPPEGPGTAQADIYSLGKVLYELSTGHDRHQFPELPTHLESPDERELLGELNEVLLKACQRNPAERYQSAAEMHADLALLESGRSVVRMRGMERRLRLVARGGALVTALTAVVSLGWWWQAKQTAAVRELAEQNQAIAQERAALAVSRDAAARESQRRLIEVHTANGLRAMEADDPATAALWFAEVLQAADADPALEWRQRDRLGNLFRRLPKPTSLFSIGAPYGTLRMASDGRELIESLGYASDNPGPGEVRFWEFTTGQRLRSVTIPDLWGTPNPSPSGRWAVVSGRERKALWDLSTGQPVPVELEMEGTGGISIWSSDETLIALVRYEGTDVSIIEVPSGRRHAPSLQHPYPVISIEFDPSRRWVATGTSIQRERTRLAPEDKVGQARVWEVHTGRPVTDWIDFGAPVDRLVFSPDGSALALFHSGSIGLTSGLEGAEVRVIDLPQGMNRFAALRHADTVVDLAFSPDGRYLATGSADSTVSVWHAHTGERLYPPLKHGHIRFTLRFSPDGAWLAAGGEAGVRLWDVRSGAPALPDLRHEEPVDFFEFSPDGRRLLTQTRSGVVRSFDLTSVNQGSPTMALGQEGGVVTSASFSSDGRRLATVGPTGQFHLWDATSCEPLGDTLFAEPETEVEVGLAQNAASWSPDDRLLVIPRGDGTARIWEVDAGRESSLRLRHPPLVNRAEFSPDGRRIVTAGDDGTARIWDATTGLEQVPPLRHQSRVIRARFSPDAGRVATASFDRTARVWDAETGDPVSPPLSHEGQVTWVEFSPDGSRVVLAGNDRSVTIRDSVSGAQMGSAMQHDASVTSARFSADGRRILTASMDRTARLWDAGTGEAITPPLRHQGFVVGGGFSPDGLRVVTGSADGTARLWDAATGEPLSPALRHAQGLLFAGFSPSGQRVVITSVDGTARMWDVAPLDWSEAELMAGARLLAAGRLGSAERVEPMAPLELEATWQTIRDRFQGDEGAGNTTSLAWHRQRLNSTEQAQQWFAAEFHAGQLAVLAPEDPGVQSDLERVLARRPPPRNPATPPELLDLSAFYNASLAIPWHAGPRGNHLASLPRGIQTFGPTRFDVRGLIQVMNGPLQGSLSYPTRVSGIRLGLKARRLQFLHATMGGQPPDGTRVGHYRVRYANGRTEELPVIYGRHARDWHEHPGAPVEADAAAIAWTGTNPATAIAGTLGIRLFKWTWENPAPDIELVSLDVVAEDTAAYPFLVALTAE